ncbi:MAG: NADH-quinone oxidoreductase subunit M [Candidatus Eisenbacteria bacterium]|nr:NADH-quinone oxidoreductase subunit M [Candidatus Eisenbacteria bacterium]
MGAVNYLSLVLFLPLVGAILLAVVPGGARVHRNFALGISGATFLLSLRLWFDFDVHANGMQFVERFDWIQSLGIRYAIGVDGLSLMLILLTTFLSTIAILASFQSITERTRSYFACLLALETGMLGVFMAFDLFFFYVFWEVMLIPMALLIGIWGGKRRVYAAIKFFLYTMAGSVLMLVAIIAVVLIHRQATGSLTFDLFQLYGTPISRTAQMWLFAAFALAFAIKIPLFPFHTWLPDAHVEAPTAGSVILAGVLLKMGTYGYMRYCLPMFPEAVLFFAPLILGLAVIGIIYGALVAMVQPDLKKLVAYSSVSHMGFVMLGIFSLNFQGLQGGMIQMINHGLSTGALFLLVGMIYDRRHTREISEFGGLTRVMPVFSIFFMITTLSSIGLPGLNGFVGEFLVILGAFQTARPFAIVGAIGVILSAVYMLWMFQRVMFGEVTKEENRKLIDLSPREWAVMVPVLILIIWIGIHPKPFLKTSEVAVGDILKKYGTTEMGQVAR